MAAVRPLAATNIKVVEKKGLMLIGMQIRTQPKSPEIPALWSKFVARKES